MVLTGLSRELDPDVLQPRRRTAIAELARGYFSDFA
jgi:hypothetical protein